MSHSRTSDFWGCGIALCVALTTSLSFAKDREERRDNNNSRREQFQQKIEKQFSGGNSGSSNSGNSNSGKGNNNSFSAPKIENA